MMAEKPTLQYDFFADAALQARIASMDEALKSTVNSLYSSLESISSDPVKEITKVIKDDEEVKGTYKEFIESLRGNESEEKRNNALEKFANLFSQEGEPEDKFNEFFAALRALFAREGEIETSRKRRDDFLWVLSRLRENWKSAETTGELTGTGNDIEFQIKQLLNLYAVWTHLNHQWRMLSTLSKSALKHSRKDDSTAAAPLHLIKKCFRQISTDSEIIQRAMLQRQWAISDDETYVESQQANALVVTDKLALMALAPMHKRLPGGSDDNYPVTYFSKSIYFRQTPHSDRILLIGISYDLTSRIQRSLQAQSDTGNNGNTTGDEIETGIELMAIPHEIGHYVFHHAKLDVIDSNKSRILPDGLVTKAQDSTNRELIGPKLSLRKLETESSTHSPLKLLKDQYKAYKKAKESDTPLKQDVLDNITESLQAIKGITEQSKKQFWVLKKLDDEQKVTFAELSYIFENNGWYEELFADMYGCLVTGPLSVLGMQSLIASSDQDRLFNAGGEHPTPILRPFIMSEMLRELSELDKVRYEFHSIAKSLDNNWKAFLSSRLNLQLTDTGDVLMVSRSDSTEIDITAKLQEVRPIIKLFAKFMVANVAHEPWGTDEETTNLSAKIP